MGLKFIKKGEFIMKKISIILSLIMVIVVSFTLTGCENKVKKENDHYNENLEKISSGNISKERNTNFDTLYSHDFTKDEIKEIVNELKNCSLTTKEISNQDWKKIKKSFTENKVLNWHAVFYDANGTFVMEFIFDEEMENIYLSDKKDQDFIYLDIKEDDSIKNILKSLTEKTKDNSVEEEPNMEEYPSINIGINGSTRDYYEYVILDEDVVKHKYSEREDDSKYKDRAGYTLNVKHYFEGVKEGKTEIWVVDVDVDTIMSITKYEIIVDSKLNAKITNSSKETKKIKCGYVRTKNPEHTVEIENESIARDVSGTTHPNEIVIMGIKEGSTTIIVKENGETEKKYTIRVDADLNVELE